MALAIGLPSASLSTPNSTRPTGSNTRVLGTSSVWGRLNVTLRALRYWKRIMSSDGAVRESCVTSQ